MAKKTKYELSITPANLLWRTCGKYWDYRFLILPNEPEVPGWYNLFNHIFDRDHFNKNTTYYNGSFQTSSAREYFFIATKFTDNNHKDEVGRDIKHHFVVVSENSNIFRDIPQNWGESLFYDINKDIDFNSIYNRQYAEYFKLSKSYTIKHDKCVDDSIPLKKFSLEDENTVLKKKRNIYFLIVLILIATVYFIISRE